MRLSQAGVPTPAVDAELLVRHVTGWSRTRLLTSRSQSLGPQQQEHLEHLARRRCAREPLQLLVGSVGFRHLDLEVRQGVFIPRPETEVLAGAAIDKVPAGGVVVEPCTGTGAIACSVAQESRASAVIATDVSSAAVALAHGNAARLGLGVQVLQGDLLAPVPAELRGQVDVLVSNPPYLAEAELAGLEPEVTRWDPHGALVSGPSGDELADQLLADGRTWLRSGGWLLLELDASRSRATANRATAAGFAEVGLLPDLTGAERFLLARQP